MFWTDQYWTGLSVSSGIQNVNRNGPKWHIWGSWMFRIGYIPQGRGTLRLFFDRYEPLRFSKMGSMEQIYCWKTRVLGTNFHNLCLGGWNLARQELSSWKCYFFFTLKKKKWVGSMELKKSFKWRVSRTKNGLKKGGSWGLHISMLLPNVSPPPPGISLQVLNLHLKHWYIGIYRDMDAALKTFIIWVQIWNLHRMWLC